ncbi:MAG: NAD(P)-dependent oxidoreductase [Alphaproteobacteria bacterium]|nr:NAD(P)-dependent oxidoreductase [Alphaproteobacteria bacterium]
MILSVLGATGYLGNHLIETMEQTAPDIGIRAFGRNHTKLRRLEGRRNIEAVDTYVYGDNFGAKLTGTDACIDLTYSIQGIPSEVMAGARDHGNALIHAAHASGLKRVVITGTVGVYGEPIIRHPWGNAPDARMLRPNTIYGMAKTAVEKTAFRAAKQLDMPVTFVRAGHIYGPGSNMAAGIAGRILTCTPALLGTGTAISNATTVDGLAHTLCNLAINGADQPVVFANHVDMEGVAYDELVKSIAQTINIRPVIGTAVINATGDSNHLVDLLRANKKKIQLTQAWVGRYDLGLSAHIIRRLKHRVGGEDAVGPSEGAAGRNGIDLVPLYQSQAVPHSAEFCGPPISANTRAERLTSIDRWLTLTGYANRG